MASVALRYLALCLGTALCSALPTQAAELSWAEKMFQKRAHDFGTVARGADVASRLKITNIYRETVHIADVRTSCGCTAASPSKSTLRSRESAYIEVTMDTRRFKRRKDSNVIVTFDQPLQAEVRIPVTAYIRTDVVLTPGSADFGAVPRGEPAERRIRVAYAGRNDWKIKAVKVGHEHLQARVEEKSRGGGRIDYELVVTLKESAPPGPLREQILLVTDDATNPHVPVLAEATVESDVTVTPEVVSLGMLVPGREKTVNVVIRGRKPFAIEKIESESATKAFKVRLPTTARTVHVVPLTVDPPQKPGEFSDRFMVTIPGRDEPVTFRAYGRIVAP